jgi:hypothetical protein
MSGCNVGLSRDDFVEVGDAEHAHHGTGYAVSGTVANGNVQRVFVLGSPVKITAHNVARLVVDEVLRNVFMEAFVLNQQCLLNARGKGEARKDLVVLLFDARFLLGDFFGLKRNLLMRGLNLKMFVL